MIAALLLLAAAQVDSIEVPMDVRPTAQRARPGTLLVPDQIAPAVLPYLQCLYASRGIELRPREGQPQPPTVAVGTDCSAQRARSADHADRLLRNRSRGTTGERRAYVESVLAHVDRSVGRLGSFTPRPAPAAEPGKPANPLPSIDMPYQILPAYRAYAACVGGRFIDDPRSRSAEDADVRGAHDAAVAACRDERAVQLARALELLTDYRPYGGSRDRARAAARAAFDQFDTVYLVEPATPAPSGRPLPRDAVEVLDPIAPAHAGYTACVATRIEAGGPMFATPHDRYRQRVGAAIAACADVRAAAIAEADAALARQPDYRDPARRAAAIRHAFDGSDRVRREMPLLAASGQMPGAAAAAPRPGFTTTYFRTLGRLDIPDALAPAMLPFLHCRLAAAGIEIRGPDGTLLGSGARADCSGARRSAASRANLVIERQGVRQHQERQTRIEALLAEIDAYVRPAPPAPGGNG